MLHTRSKCVSTEKKRIALAFHFCFECSIVTSVRWTKKKLQATHALSPNQTAKTAHTIKKQAKHHKCMQTFMMKTMVPQKKELAELQQQQQSEKVCVHDKSLGKISICRITYGCRGCIIMSLSNHSFPQPVFAHEDASVSLRWQIAKQRKEEEKKNARLKPTTTVNASPAVHCIPEM